MYTNIQVCHSAVSAMCEMHKIKTYTKIYKYWEEKEKKNCIKINKFPFIEIDLDGGNKKIFFLYFILFPSLAALTLILYFVDGWR